MTPYQAATIISNEHIGEHVRHVSLTTSPAIPYSPGQFFLIRVKNSAGDFVERSYSAAHFSEGNRLEFVIRIEPGGQMSSLIDLLSPGHQIDIKGPFGRFGTLAIMGHQVRQMILIAGGVGIAPLRSIIQGSFRSGESFPITLLYGFRTPKDFLFQAELEEFKKSGRLQIVPAVSDSAHQDGWKGLRGYISDHFEGHVAPAEGVHALICGPPPMVKASREKLLLLGFDRRQVHVEAW